MNELIAKIRAWANARNLINGSTDISQYAKLMSEVGETASAILSSNISEICDGVGDCFVVLVIICAIAEINIEHCCAGAPLAINSNPSLADAERVMAQTSECLRLMVTLGDLGDALLKKNKTESAQAVGGAVRRLNRIARAQGQTLKHCVGIAYDEIKDRKGVMYNGTFIKASDERYQNIMRELVLEI
jgi:hypothetical protein